MFECVQGEGGVNNLDYNFVKAIEKLAKEKDILMVVDEVQTGNGRTGRYFAYENFDIKPDIVSTAKGLAGGGLPMGAVLFGEKRLKIPSLPALTAQLSAAILFVQQVQFQSFQELMTNF